MLIVTWGLLTLAPSRRRVESNTFSSSAARPASVLADTGRLVVDRPGRDAQKGTDILGAHRKARQHADSQFSRGQRRRDRQKLFGELPVNDQELCVPLSSKRWTLR